HTTKDKKGGNEFSHKHFVKDWFSLRTTQLTDTLTPAKKTQGDGFRPACFAEGHKTIFSAPQVKIHKQHVTCYTPIGNSNVLNMKIEGIKGNLSPRFGPNRMNGCLNNPF